MGLSDGGRDRLSDGQNPKREHASLIQEVHAGLAQRERWIMRGLNVALIG